MAQGRVMTCCQAAIFAIFLVVQPIFAVTKSDVMSARVEVLFLHQI